MDEKESITISFNSQFFAELGALPLTLSREASLAMPKVHAVLEAGNVPLEPVAGSEDLYLLALSASLMLVVSHPADQLFNVLWVGSEEQARAWAQTHVCRINPESGSVQVYEAVREDAFPMLVADDRAPLFAEIPEQTLRSIGVPPECLPLLARVHDVAELELLRDHMPLDVLGSLKTLADGGTLEEVQAEYGEPVKTSDPLVALKSPRSRASFRVIEGDEDMMRVMDASLEVWRVFLHPTQRRLVEREAETPMLVRGAAGTGKTVVAMHRAVNLVRRPDWHNGEMLLFTTFTKNLATDISVQLDTLCSPDERRRIEVTNIDAWVVNFLKRNNVTKTIAFSGNFAYDACWRSALSLMPLSIGESERFYEEEWRRVILPQEILTEAEYLRASRRGRGKPLSRKDRKAIWPVFDEMRSQMSSHGLMSFEDACFMAIRILESEKGITHYRAVVVDETQDLGNEALRLLAHLARPEGEPNAEPRIFLVGDGQQRIYARHGSLAACGINVRGRRSARLKLTYRTTEEIRRAANAVLEGMRFDDMDEGAETQSGALSNRHGLVPTLYGAQSLEDEVDWVLERIGEIKRDLRLADGDICIVARTNAMLLTYEEALEARGLTLVRLSRKFHDDRAVPGVRLATMHRVKGLEYKVVFIVGASDGQVPLALNTSSDAEERRLLELTERSLFYVAASRAKDALFISYAGAPGAFVSLLAPRASREEKALESAAH